MRIETIAIKDLFGYYSYDVKLGDRDQLFIITGLNGSGKTTIMRILDSLSQGKLHFFYELPYSSIEIQLKNDQDPSGQSIRIVIVKNTVEKQDPKKSQNQPDTNVMPEMEVVFVCYVNEKGKEKKVSEAVLKKRQKELISSIDYYFEGVNLIKYRSDETLSNYPNVDNKHYSIVTRNIRNKKGVPFTFYSSFNVKFIEAQRLLISEIDNDNKQSTLKPTIKDVADRLAMHLKEARYDFLDESQKKSNNLIEKLLSSSDDGMSADEYNMAREELMSTVDELNAYNLANESIFPYDESKRGILSVYIQDQKAKLEIFSNVLRELNLFSNLLKRKRFAHKEISFSPQYGLRAYTDKGTPIDLENLSSGEQNEIIILYKLIFDVPSDIILLIDEPEISLHVIWQEEFLSDLEEIAKVRKQQMIIATHSPQIIGNRWKQCYDLTEQNLNR